MQLLESAQNTGHQSSPHYSNVAPYSNFQYISWISTVSGRLFFHLTDGFNYRNDRIVGDVLHYNEKPNVSNSNRVFFLSMLVDLRDLRERDKSKYTRVIVLAETASDSIKTLQGSVYFIDDKNHIGLYKGKPEVEFLQNINSLIKGSSAPSYDDFKTKLVSYLSNLENEQEGNNSAIFVENIEFIVRETGIIFLKKDHQPDGMHEVDPDIKAAFHILKFTFHKDRFHHTSAEEIVRIVSTNNDKEKIANKLVTGIKRYIAEMRKKNDDPPSLQNLKGIIDYAEALVLVLGKEDYYGDERHPIQEKKLLDKIDKSIDKELETKPYHPATIYRFISEIQSIAVMSLAVLAPFLIIYSKDFISGKDFIHSLVISAYICLFLFMLIIIFIFNISYNRTLKSAFIGKNIIALLKKLNIIKRWSKPNISSEMNFFPKFIIPRLVDWEMLIRRENKHIKTLLLFLFSAGVFYLFFIQDSNINKKEQFIDYCPLLKPVPDNMIKDNNKTYLIIKENISPLVLELKKIRENIAILGQRLYQKNDTERTKNLTAHTRKTQVKVKGSQNSIKSKKSNAVHTRMTQEPKR